MEKIAVRKNKEIFIEDGNVIKLFIESHPKSNILSEALNQARVEEASNLNVPKLVEIKKINDRWALISEFIEGKTIKQLMEEDPNNFDKYLKLFVKVQLTILDNSVPLLNRMKDKFTRKIEETDIFDENTKYELLGRLNGMKNHNELCHGDYLPSNVIIQNDGTVYVIDWAHATCGNAAADAARTYLMFSMEGHENLADEYLTLFSEMSKIPKKTIQQWAPIVAATRMTKNIPEEQEFLSRWVNVVDYE